MSPDTINKGSNVGRIESNHRRRPDFEASKVCLGKNSKKKNKINKGRSLFKFVPADDFLYLMCRRRK